MGVLKSKSIPLLQSVTDAITGWRQIAKDAQIELQQMNVNLPDGTHLVYAWNSTDNDWDITT